MNLSSLRGRPLNSRLCARLALVSLAVPVLLLSSGCDRVWENDFAGRDFDAGSETLPTVPAEPVKPAQESKASPAILGIGDVNPGLRLAKWIKGEPVEQNLTGDKVHVVEFWATWCGPCRTGMPHISQLQEEYGDQVAFIGVTREPEATVAGFLQSASPDGRTWDEVIQYRLAIDDGDWTNTAYMRAAGQNGIPCAFVVGREGVVEWIGHPGRIDGPLREIVDGNWDREAAIAEQEQQERLKDISIQIAQFARAKDWDGALELVGQLEDEMGKSKGLLDYRLRLLQSAGRSEDVSKVRAELVEVIWDDPMALNEFAWKTATSGASEDLELALKAATRGSELRHDEDAMILDTLARCHYELNDLDEAIRWQRLAVEHNQGLREIDSTLKRYLNEKEAAENQEAEKEGSDETSAIPADDASSEEASVE